MGNPYMKFRLCQGVPKISARFDHSLKGFMKLWKAIILLVIVYYSERIQIKVAKEKATMEEKECHRLNGNVRDICLPSCLPLIKERPGISFQPSSPSRVLRAVVNPHSSDHMCGALPTGEAHPGLCPRILLGVRHIDVVCSRD